MSAPGSAHRAGLALLAAVLLVLGGAGGAAASADGSGGSLSETAVGDGQVRALLTFPASVAAPRIDLESLRAAFGSGAESPVEVQPVARKHRAALLLVDTSGSMAGAQLAAAQAAARRFLAGVPDDVAVGLAAFATNPQLLVAPTHDRARVQSALAGLHAVGRTALYDAVGVATGALGARGSRTLVLLSDGGNTSGRTDLPTALDDIRRSGVRVTAIGFQTDTSQYAVLRKLAETGHGTLTRALGGRSLRAAFAAAARQIATQVRIRTPIPEGVGGRQTLRVSGIVDGTPFTAVTEVDLPSVAAAAVSLPAATTGAARGGDASSSDMVTWFGGAAVFGGLFVVALIAASPLLAGPARRRIRTLDAYGRVTPVPDRRGRGLGKDVTDAALRVGGAWARSREQSGRTALLLERADLPLRVEEWYVLRAVGLFVPALLVGLLFNGSTGGAIIGGLVGMLIGAVVPTVLLRFLAARRARRFEMQLPDVLTLMATSLTTGFSLPQAIDAIVQDAAEPTSKEFARALAETRIGADLEDALERTATRMDSVNLAWTNMAVRIQRQVGGSLADTLRTTAATLRERESLRRQVRALSAEGRLSAYILIALPIFLAGYLYLTNRSYLALLWERPLGLAMLTFAVVALVIGSFWMRRTVTVEV